MEQVQVFKTQDGLLFATAQEAKEHEESLVSVQEMAGLKADLIAAGWKTEQAQAVLRGAAIYKGWKETKKVPAPVARPRKAA